MKKIAIKSLDIRNFKGQNTLAIFNNHNCIIKGKNGIGKSIIMKSWAWLLSGYTDSVNPKNSDIYDNTKVITPDTPTASVKAIISIDDIEYSIERTAKASFSKEKESGDYKKDASDIYIQKIDDVEVSVSFFKEWIETNICPYNMITYLIDGAFFVNLSIKDKEEGRKILENIIGEIKNEDFKGDYAMLFELIEKYSIDDLKIQSKNRIKPINQRLKELPALIEQKEKDITHYSVISFKDIKKEIAVEIEKISEIDRQLEGSADSIKPIIEKRNQELLNIDRLKRELKNNELNYNYEQSKVLQEISKKIKEVDKSNDMIVILNKSQRDSFLNYENQLNALKKELFEYQEQREELVTQKNNCKYRIFNVDKCAFCGSELPIDKINELREAFNKEKEKELELIIAQGLKVRGKIDTLKDKIIEIENLIKAGYKVAPLESKESLQLELVEAQKNVKIYSNTDEYKKLSNNIIELEKNVTKIPEQDNSLLTEAKKERMENLSKLNKTMGLEKVILQYNDDLNNLRNEQRASGIQLAKIQKILKCINDYIEEKAQIISSRVNDLLSFAQIEMQTIQKDGSIRPDCIVCREDGVKYATLNTSDRILVILDIQRMFCKYYGCMLPIWIDECSIIDDNRLPEYNDAQCLYIKRDECDLLINEIN